MAKKTTIKTKKMIGLIEEIKMYGNGKNKILMAKIDTGASKSSMDVKLAAELHLGPVIKSKLVKSASGSKIRPVIEAKIVLAGKKAKEEFTLADRSHLKYSVLIGQNILKHGFLIDPSKKQVKK